MAFRVLDEIIQLNNNDKVIYETSKFLTKLTYT